MRKRILLIALLLASTTYAQQIGNSDLESWDNLGSSSEEPTNWNSFKTASGTMAWAGSQQISRSTSVRTGTTGTYCARIWSNSVLGIVANGNMTLGRVNMGNSTATHPDNYNFSKTDDANFSEPLTSAPDSLVFWVKYTAASNQEARVSGVLHDSFDYRDGYNVDANSEPHKVAEISFNYSPTNGEWVRKSVPWSYVGPATNNTFILLTFSTNKTPGGGAANDEVLIDDIELIYNPTSSIEELSNNVTAYVSEDKLFFSGITEEASFVIYNAAGQEIAKGITNSALNVSELNGVHFIHLMNESNKRIIKVMF
jgi:hypothetical protein